MRLELGRQVAEDVDEVGQIGLQVEAAASFATDPEVEVDQGFQGVNLALGDPIELE